MMQAAIIQMAVEPGNAAVNMGKAAAFVTEAAKQGCDFIVLPELWYGGYALDRLDELAAPLASHPGILRMQQLAKEYGVMLAAGSVATVKDGKYYNTAVLIGETGQIIGQYDKIHLFPLGLHEDQYFTPGEDFCLVDTPWGRLGIILCYDIRFPALCQNLALQGAELLIIPAQFGAARIQHWNILAQARAIENQCFVLACDVTGDKDSGYCGSSLMVSPWGELIAHGDEREQILYGELDFSQIEKVRRTIPVFQQRRSNVDEIDNNLITKNHL
jgi:omega-amidase